MNVEGQAGDRTIELARRRLASVVVLDQTRLPYEIRVAAARGRSSTSRRAIRDMHVRGAPLIGATAAYGVALAMRADAGDARSTQACDVLAATRPTAVNLRWALDRMRAALRRTCPPTGARGRRVAAAARSPTTTSPPARRSARTAPACPRRRSQRAGERPVRVLTHCNAGWLATVDWGTALAPIYKAHDAGIPVHVWVDETRPRNQGLLTAWELAQHGVPHTRDRRQRRRPPDAARRRSTCASSAPTARRATATSATRSAPTSRRSRRHDNGVPFYVAVPSLDHRLDRRRAAPRSRSRSAAATRSGSSPAATPTVARRGSSSSVRRAASANPAFDVTPRRLVTGLITERGIAWRPRPGCSPSTPSMRGARHDDAASRRPRRRRHGG